MDQFIFASLSHTHYWYEVGMLKVPAEYIFSYYFRFLLLIVWRVRRTFLPSEWCFPTLRPWAGFLTSAYYICENSISQSINQSKWCRTLSESNVFRLKAPIVGTIMVLGILLVPLE